MSVLGSNSGHRLGDGYLYQLSYLWGASFLLASSCEFQILTRSHQACKASAPPTEPPHQHSKRHFQFCPWTCFSPFAQRHTLVPISPLRTLWHLLAGELGRTSSCRKGQVSTFPKAGPGCLYSNCPGTGQLLETLRGIFQEREHFQEG